MKKICIIIGSRANYGTSKSIIQEGFSRAGIDMQLIINSSAVNEKFGNVSELIEKDGFRITEKCYSLVEGEGLSPMVKTSALNLIHLADSLTRLEPDAVLTIGDRYETISTAIAASYMNIPVGHVMGGELSGTIDEPVRHAITKLSHIHFPATKLAGRRIEKMGEEKHRIHVVGCPRIDLVKSYLQSNDPPKVVLDELAQFGVGDDINIGERFILFSFHPVTTEFLKTKDQISEVLSALNKIKIPVIALWPNSDAGSDSISQALRIWRENSEPIYKKRLYKNLSTLTYTWLMKKTVCQVGNSSSGIREGSFIGTPCVNIGNRQKDREVSDNVLHVEIDSQSIAGSILQQINHGPYRTSALYGSGNAGSAIIDVLQNYELNIEKRMSY
jgi:UDP-hydrolysing UDP-N-acetyl-D-glucosamine 2-epimerase